MKMIKNLITFLMITLVLWSGICVFAEENAVYDQADLLSAEEEDALNELVKKYHADWNMNFLVVTTEDTEGKTTPNYADDFYDAHFPEDSEEDGILYLIDMENREIYVSTSGLAIRYLTDQRIDHLLDRAYEYVSEGDYFGTFESFLEGTEVYLKQGISQGQYNYDTETGEIDPYVPKRQITPMECLIALIAGLAAAGGTMLFIKAKYQLKFEDFHYDAYTDSEIQLTVREDHLINTMVTHRRIPRDDDHPGGRSSGNASSVHSSGSGRSHGGGGRSF